MGSTPQPRFFVCFLIFTSFGEERERERDGAGAGGRRERRRNSSRLCTQFRAHAGLSRTTPSSERRDRESKRTAPPTGAREPPRLGSSGGEGPPPGLGPCGGPLPATFTASVTAGTCAATTHRSPLTFCSNFPLYKTDVQCEREPHIPTRDGEPAAPAPRAGGIPRTPGRRRNRHVQPDGPAANSGPALLW